MHSRTVEDARPYKHPVITSVNECPLLSETRHQCKKRSRLRLIGDGIFPYTKSNRILGGIEALVSLFGIFFLRRCEMIRTTDRRQNHINNGEKKNAKHSGSAALDHLRRPNEGERKGSNAQNTVKENFHQIRLDPGEDEQEIAKRNQHAEQKPGPHQRKVDRRASGRVGKEDERQNGEHEICARVSDIRF